MRPLKTVDARLLFEHELTFICQNKLQKIKKKYQVTALRREVCHFVTYKKY